LLDGAEETELETSTVGNAEDGSFDRGVKLDAAEGDEGNMLEAPLLGVARERKLDNGVLLGDAEGTGIETSLLGSAEEGSCDKGVGLDTVESVEKKLEPPLLGNAEDRGVNDNVKLDGFEDGEEIGLDASIVGNDEGAFDNVMLATADEEERSGHWRRRLVIIRRLQTSCVRSM
jgi:hypothetical protein